MKSVLLACVLALAGVVESAAQTAPDTTRTVLHGMEVRDPYRHLEQTETPRVLQWLRQQDSLARSLLQRVPERSALHARVRELATTSTYSVPQITKGALFHLEVDGRTDERRIVRRSHDGRETVLRFETPPAAGEQLSNFAPDPAGRRLLYELHDEVSGSRTLYVGDIAADGAVRTHLSLENAGTSAHPWLSDGSAFVVTRGAAGRDTAFLIHLSDADHPEPLHVADSDEMTLRPRVSDDDGWVIITGSSASRSVVDVVALSSPRTAVRVTPASGEAMDFVGITDGRLLFRTDVGAPTGRVVSLDPDAPAPAGWRDVVPARPGATLRAAFAVGGRLLLSYLEGPTPFLVIRDGSAETRVDVPLGLLWTDHLPGWSAFSAHADERTAYFRSINLSAPGIYAVDVVNGSVTPYQLRETGVDPTLFEARIETYTSSDGTRIPLYLIGRRDRGAGPHPVLVFAYGAYGFTAIPFFNAKYVTFIENGGTFAIPFTRGDGVFGDAWHRAGTGAGKLTTVQDLIAAAEHLIASGHATASSLGIEGQGPGGMVAASAVMLRPELWGAATLEAPVTDPIRMLALRGRPSSEYGDLNDPETVRALLAFGPVYRVQAGAEYPPILIRTGDRDRTIAPFHSYKLAAALRAASPESHTYLRISWSEAHGFLRAAEQRAQEWADDLVFLQRFLEVR